MAETTIGSVGVDVTANTEKLEDAFAKADKSVNSFAEKTKARIDKAFEALEGQDFSAFSGTIEKSTSTATTRLRAFINTTNADVNDFWNDIVKSGQKSKQSLSAADAFGAVANQVGPAEKFKNALSGITLGSGAAGKAVKALGVAAGNTGGEFASIASSYIAMGPAIGGAVAAMTIYNSVQQKAAEIAAFNNDHISATIALMRAQQDISGQAQAPGFFSGDVASDVEKVNTALSKMTEDFTAAANSWKYGRNELEGMDRKINQLRDQQRGLLKVQTDLDKASGERAAMESASFENKRSTKSGSVDRIFGDLEIQTAYAQKLEATLAKLPEGGREYNKVLKEWQSTTLSVNDLQQALYDKNDAAREKAAAQVKKNSDEFIAHLKAESDAAKAMGEEMTKSMRTPFEVFADELDKSQGLLEKGLITPEIAERAAMAAADAFASASGLDKVEKSIGTFTTLDVSQMGDVGAGNERQKVEDPQLKITNESLKTLIANTKNMGAYAQ